MHGYEKWGGKQHCVFLIGKQHCLPPTRKSEGAIAPLAPRFRGLWTGVIDLRPRDNILRTSGKKFSMMISKPVTICIVTIITLALNRSRTHHEIVILGLRIRY